MNKSFIARLSALAFTCGLGLIGPAWGADPTDEEFFELHVRPLLVEKCGACHIDSDEGGLLFTGRDQLLKGGDFGPAIVPGAAAKSLLTSAVRWTAKDLRMPPDEDDRLTADEIALVERWIDRGAVWPGAAAAPAITAEGGRSLRVTSDHWAFQPVKRPPVPDVADPEWNGSPIDAFIHAGHVAAGIAPAPRADRLNLLRRATFDLHGLPPTPEEIAAFERDEAPEAFARVVDRLLASPAYGERWGRHWLDVARYADTAGDVGDYPIPTAHLYRDWVIDSLNADLPIDRFLEAQIAGDLLADAEPVPTGDPTVATDADALRHRRDLTMATGFISLSRRFGNDKAGSMHLTIEDTIDTVGRGMMGLTLRCARCHDHKFDPLLATDYYRLYGIFASTRYPWMGMSVEKSPAALVPLALEADARAKTDRYWDTIARYEYQINNHLRPWLEPTLNAFAANAKARVAAGDADPARWADLDRRREELLAAHDGRFRELMLHGLDWLKDEKERLASRPPYPMLYAVSEGTPADARLHRRGNPELLGDAVPRGMPAVVAGDHPPSIGADAGSGRLELARWLSSLSNPLTARVFVNRVWHHHFGRGLVPTLDNFGLRGERPSHPELLNWLADSFMADGWSLKRLHRRILLSRAWQAAAADDPAAAERDPANALVWRHPRRRLEAEAIRDTLLAVAGTLDTGRGGPHPFPSGAGARFDLNQPFRADYASRRRSVYLMTQRLFRHPVLGIFDGPDTNSTMAARRTSTVPAQSLLLMNNAFGRWMARDFADRLAADVPAGGGDRVERAWLLAFGRRPDPREHDEALAFVAEAAKAGGAEARGWEALAWAVLTSNETIYID
ncbi:MAG: PSD1 and planctomycete cytochrome C domain-containing protein [Planctomycetota bacterium]